MSQFPAPAFLRLPAVLSLIGVSKATLYRWMGAGLFPQAVALTPTRSTVAWVASEVHAWIASKQAESVGISVGTFDGEALKAA